MTKLRLLFCIVYCQKKIFFSFFSLLLFFFVAQNSHYTIWVKFLVVTYQDKISNLDGYIVLPLRNYGMDFRFPENNGK